MEFKSNRPRKRERERMSTSHAKARDHTVLTNGPTCSQV
jgi:hypothetical protein